MCPRLIPLVLTDYTVDSTVVRFKIEPCFNFNLYKHFLSFTLVFEKKHDFSLLPFSPLILTPTPKGDSPLSQPRCCLFNLPLNPCTVGAKRFKNPF